MGFPCPWWSLEEGRIISFSFADNMLLHHTILLLLPSKNFTVASDWRRQKYRIRCRTRQRIWKKNFPKPPGFCFGLTGGQKLFYQKKQYNSTEVVVMFQPSAVGAWTSNATLFSIFQCNNALQFENFSWCFDLNHFAFLFFFMFCQLSLWVYSH